ncbi:hypothetical protein E2C01_009572 [Portunus trituberculatus]|uniref:Uncharacterized protein n=1 Tax=Portunus trituberculatus TaxID=210409 RepID=A0A5B7D653_PORTR|nr:hypothetical protein [Portunus trituberculatus]
MSTPASASESPSGEGTINVPRSDSSISDGLKCLDPSLNFSFINFCNICGLKSNFQFVEHHLSSAKPHLLFLTETQLPEATDNILNILDLFPYLKSFCLCCDLIFSVGLLRSLPHICILYHFSNPSSRSFKAEKPLAFCLCFGGPEETHLLCAERITEVIVSGTEAYIPHSFSQPKPPKLWFNTACYHAIHNREVAHKRYLSLKSPESHALYIFARNHAKSVLQLAKHSFINRKCQNLSNSSSSQYMASSQKHQ